jgi:hypothetical protein
MIGIGHSVGVRTLFTTVVAVALGWKGWSRRVEVSGWEPGERDRE